MTLQPTDYALQVTGNSMEPAILDGAYVICRPADEAAIGELVVAQLDEFPAPEWTPVLKVLGEVDGQRALLSTNPSYPPKRGAFRILARVVQVYRTAGGQA